VLTAANYTHMTDILEHLLEEFLARRQGVDVAAHITESELAWVISMKQTLALVRENIADIAQAENVAAIRAVASPLIGTALCPGPSPGAVPGSFQEPGPSTF